MSKVTDNWDKWVKTAEHLAYKFQNAVEYNARDDEFATAWDMMEFLQETVAAIKPNGVINGNLKSNNPPGYDGHDGPDKEGWDD